MMLPWGYLPHSRKIMRLAISSRRVLHNSRETRSHVCNITGNVMFVVFVASAISKRATATRGKTSSRSCDRDFHCDCVVVDRLFRTSAMADVPVRATFSPSSQRKLLNSSSTAPLCATSLSENKVATPSLISHYCRRPHCEGTR